MHRKLAAALLGVVAFSGLTKAEEAAPNTGALSLTGGIDYVTAYYFRGINQEDSGLIVQPYLTLSAAVYKTDALSITPYVGVWNSLHEHETAGGDGNLYETDWFGGVDFKFGDWTLGAIYTFYTSPSDAFSTIEELGFKLSYDDTNLMKKLGVPLALKPYVAWYIETDDEATEDQYFEIGITPSVALPNTPVTLSFPLAAGFSPDGYYFNNRGNNESLGFVSAGVQASMPLGEPGKFGAWTLTAGVSYIHLFADSLEAVNDDDDSAWVGKLGVSFAY